jgi:hypothetical protein
VRQVATLTSGTTYTFSCFGKFGALSSGFSLNVFDENAASYGSGVCQAFNLNEGTLGASGTIGAGFTLQSVGMEDYGNGWYRCRMTVLMGYTPTAPRVGFRIGTQITGRPSSVASGTVNAWGAQLETGSVATSYIPTTTAAVTRNADVILVSGAVSGSIGQTQGTIYAEVDVKLLSTNRSLFSLCLNSNTTDFINFQINTSNRLFARIRNKTGSLVDVVASGVTTTAGIHKLACSYSSGDITFALDGVVIGTNTNADTDFTAALNYVLLGSGPGAATGGTQSAFLNDRILDGALYTTRLTNAELAALTSL